LKEASKKWVAESRAAAQEAKKMRQIKIMGDF
jgi:hypothetical protein